VSTRELAPTGCGEAEAGLARLDGDRRALVANDLPGRRDRLSYAARLRRGSSTGIGLVEGTIKQWVVPKMKRSGARRLAEHVGPLVKLCAVVDGAERDRDRSTT
jgi:hypothetical protein